jgi:hypothetical protein
MEKVGHFKFRIMLVELNTGAVNVFVKKTLEDIWLKMKFSVSDAI